MPRLPGSSIQWQLIAPLYKQKAALIMGGVTLPLVACISWSECRQSWLLGWAAAMLFVLGARLLLVRAFERHAESTNSRLWTRRFVLGAWAFGALWGCAAFVIVTGVEPMIQMVLLMTRGVCVMGGAARNAGSLPAARGQIFFAVTPGIIVCMATHKPIYLVLGLLMILEIIAALTIMKNINEKTVEALTLNEENAGLVAQWRLAANELELANSRLKAMTLNDALTGIANRRCFDQMLAAEISRVQRHPMALSLLMIDIDFFKSFNDLYGHLGGDDCLRRVAQTIAAVSPLSSDLVARYGGEEFVAILPQADAEAAALIAEHVRAAIEGLGVTHAGANRGTVTVSIGVASCPMGRHLQAIDLVRSADDALYAAKGAGRNCVRLTNIAPLTQSRSDAPIAGNGGLVRIGCRS